MYQTEVAHDFNPSIPEAGACGSRVSSRTARATQRNPASKSINQSINLYKTNKNNTYYY